MTSMSVRHGRQEDVPAILAIDAACLALPHWGGDFYRQLVSAPSGGAVQRVLLVAEQAGQVLGFAVGSAVMALVPCEVELENLAVAPAARGRGVGAALVRAVVAWAGELGGGAVRLEVRSQNGAAIGLYRRLGFEPIGMRRGYYTGPADDALCMQCMAAAAEAE